MVTFSLRLLTKFEFPTRISNKTCLNILLIGSCIFEYLETALEKIIGSRVSFISELANSNLVQTLLNPPKDLRYWSFLLGTRSKFLWGARVVASSVSPPPYKQFLPLPTPYFKMFLERFVMTPTTTFQTSFTVILHHPLHYPCPPPPPP